MAKPTGLYNQHLQTKGLLCCCQDSGLSLISHMILMWVVQAQLSFWYC